MQIKTMAKPKQFTSERFKIKLNEIIERLIADKQTQSNLAEHRSDIRVAEIAILFNVNASTLRRWCVEHVERSPSQYLAEYRIKRAKQLLRHGVKPSEVAEMLAFAEHKIFSTTFKRYQGVSPSYFIKAAI